MWEKRVHNVSLEQHFNNYTREYDSYVVSA